MAAKTEITAASGIPTDRDVAPADKAGRTLDALIGGSQPVSARIGAQKVDIPTPAVRLLRVVLD